MYKKYGATARIGYFTWNVLSPLFGKYYVDIQTPFGNENTDTPEAFDTEEQAERFLTNMGFVKAIG